MIRGRLFFRDRRRKVEPLRHPGRGTRRNRRIFRKCAKAADRQTATDPVSRLKPGDVPAHLFNDAGAFISKGQGHFVILYQSDSAGQIENIHRIDRRGFDLN